MEQITSGGNKQKIKKMRENSYLAFPYQHAR